MEQPNNLSDQQEPGSGAIEFAKEFTDGLTFEEAQKVIKKLYAGKLHDISDKRIKRCEYCNHYYRDKTRPNNSKTCSSEHKKANDALKKRKKRVDLELVKPKKHEKADIEYTYWLEYPFFVTEKAMWKYTRIMEKNMSTENVEMMDGFIQTGTRSKKPSKHVRTHINSQLHKYKQSKKPSELKVTKKSRQEIDAELLEKYGTKKLQQERKRATKWKKF